MSLFNKKRQREVLLHYWNKGVRSVPKLHKLTKIPVSTLYYNVKKLKEKGTVKHKRGNGRPKKITPEISRTIGQYIRRDTSIPLKNIANKISQKGVQLHFSTISKHLTSIGYKKNLPRATPMLTQKHKENRVEWAKKHLNYNWKKVLFTDETAFQLFRNTIQHWYKNKRPVRRIPKDRTKIFAWAGFCMKGTTSLFCFQTIMTGNFYVEILQKHLPEVKQLFRGRWVWQQDNDPKHTSRVAKKFLQENVPEVLDWPSNSPDLNPIENLWSIVKTRVERRMPKNCHELELFMMEEWANIPQTILMNLVNSMPKRCQAIIDNNGERIDF